MAELANYRVMADNYDLRLTKSSSADNGDSNGALGGFFDPKDYGLDYDFELSLPETNKQGIFGEGKVTLPTIIMGGTLIYLMYMLVSD